MRQNRDKGMVLLSMSTLMKDEVWLHPPQAAIRYLEDLL